MLRVLLPAALNQGGPARGGLWARIPVPLWGCWQGRPERAISDGDLVQQRMVIETLVGFPPCPQLPQDNPKRVHIDLFMSSCKTASVCAQAFMSKNLHAPLFSVCRVQIQRHPDKGAPLRISECKQHMHCLTCQRGGRPRAILCPQKSSA